MHDPFQERKGKVNLLFSLVVEIIVVEIIVVEIIVGEVSAMGCEIIAETLLVSAAASAARGIFAAAELSFVFVHNAHR